MPAKHFKLSHVVRAGMIVYIRGFPTVITLLPRRTGETYADLLPEVIGSITGGASQNRVHHKMFKRIKLDTKQGVLKLRLTRKAMVGLATI